MSQFSQIGALLSLGISNSRGSTNDDEMFAGSYYPRTLLIVLPDSDSQRARKAWHNDKLIIRALDRRGRGGV